MFKYTSVHSQGMPETKRQEEEKDQEQKDKDDKVHQVKHKKSMSQGPVENQLNNDDEDYMDEQTLIGKIAEKNKKREKKDHEI